MEKIPSELLKKYNCFESVEAAKESFGENKYTEITFYDTFLKQTDYLTYKLAEGLISKEDKAEEFKARQFCRDEINRLSNEVITEKE